jgi:hypothetical protein
MMWPGIIVLILGLLLLSSGCIQPQEKPEVSERTVVEEWKPDGTVGQNEYSRSMVLQSPARQGYSGGRMEVSWKNDEDYLYLALKGSTDGWVSLGFDPSEWMKDADMILGWVEGGKAVVRDEYSTGNYGPHLEDTELGGSDDILASGGRQEGDYTVIEVKRRLDTGDRFDKAFTPGQRISAIWAMGRSDDSEAKHDVAQGEAVLTLTGGGAGTAVANLSPGDVQGIVFIWEEEKVARDLYSSFYQGTNLTIFADLARSEQRHMDQAGMLMDRYGLTAPATGEPGVFSNETLERLYADLLARGRWSEEDALTAAVVFEEISIVDLEREISSARAEDVRVVYQGLLAGSRKHLRSYVRDLEDRRIRYTPEYLSPEEYREIVKAS